MRTLHVIERPGAEFDSGSRPGVGAAGAALSHLFLIAAVFALLQIGPRQSVDQTPDTQPAKLIWVPHDAGGGHRGGGNRSTTPARRQQAPGKQERSIASAATASATTDVEPTTEPLPTLARPMEAALSALVGEMMSERPADFLGRNTGPGGDGDGPPRGAGKGPAGIGDGVRAGGPGVTTPIVITQAKPQYTAEAMRAKVQGVVMVECVVLPDGTVGDARVVRSLDPRFGLDDEAMAAAKRWRFRPGLLNGKPVPVVVTIELSFTLR